MKYELIKYFLLLILCMGCSQPKDRVFEKFESELEKQGLSIEKVDGDGLIHVSHNNVVFEVSLDNLRKDFERDQDDLRIVEFVKTMKSQFSVMPDWEFSKDKVYVGLLPNDIDFTDLINEEISEKFRKVFSIHFDNQIRYISEKQVINWGITREELKEQANENLSKLLNNSQLEIEDMDGRKLGFINCPESTLKASLIFCDDLRQKVEKDFGWPIHAAIPVRDFCYIFSKNDFQYFSNRIGNIVVEEYTQSGYPITTEVLEISEAEIKPVGAYPIE